MGNIQTCLACSDVFNKNLSESDLPHIYCCQDCLNSHQEYLRQTRTPQKKLELVCEKCGEMFFADRSTRYCCQRCRDEVNRALVVKTKIAILDRDGFRCIYCGRCSYTGCVQLEVDHIVPVALGGDNVVSNLVTACRECNHQKRDRILKNINNILKQVKKRNEAYGFLPTQRVVGVRA